MSPPVRRIWGSSPTTQADCKLRAANKGAIRWQKKTKTARVNVDSQLPVCSLEAGGQCRFCAGKLPARAGNRARSLTTVAPVRSGLSSRKSAALHGHGRGQGSGRGWSKSFQKGNSMKATKNQLATVARALLCGSTRLGSVNLTVDKFRAAIEGGHPCVGGMKFDTPKQSVLEGVIAEICAEFAGGLAVPGSVVLVTADNIGTFVRKTGEVAVRRRVTSDCGKARPAVAWIHKLRGSIGKAHD